VIVLLSGWGAVRLHAHQMRPHWHTLGRVLRIGTPHGAEGLIQWGSNFALVVMINRLDPSSVASAAFMNAVRIESISYLPGFAFAIAAATMVGQSLGMRDWHRARRCGYLAYAVGGGIMIICGILFIVFGRTMATWMLSKQESTAALTGHLLFLTGFIQAGFAASMIFSGALRGAGDTLAVMVINLSSIVGVRLAGSVVVVYFLGGAVVAVWTVMCAELAIRGLLAWGRFATGKWRHVEV
jgi:Na+-driven multidrug efflux pump